MSDVVDVSWETTPKSIIEKFTVKADRSEFRYIPEDAFHDLAETIESYANFQVGIAEAGEDL